MMVKSMKNKDSRLEPAQLGVLLYGRNLTDKDGNVLPVVKELLKCGRTHLIEKKKIRARESITAEEIEMLEEKYIGADLPTDEGASWQFNGFAYQNMRSLENDFKYEHPNREFLVKRYLLEINAEIGDYNRDVMKEWKADAQKYETV